MTSHGCHLLSCSCKEASPQQTLTHEACVTGIRVVHVGVTAHGTVPTLKRAAALGARGSPVGASGKGCVTHSCGLQFVGAALGAPTVPPGAAAFLAGAFWGGEGACVKSCLPLRRRTTSPTDTGVYPQAHQPPSTGYSIQRPGQRLPPNRSFSYVPPTCPPGDPTSSTGRGCGAVVTEGKGAGKTSLKPTQ